MYRIDDADGCGNFVGSGASTCYSDLMILSRGGITYYGASSLTAGIFEPCDDDDVRVGVNDGDQNGGLG